MARARGALSQPSQRPSPHAMPQATQAAGEQAAGNSQDPPTAGAQQPAGDQGASSSAAPQQAGGDQAQHSSGAAAQQPAAGQEAAPAAADPEQQQEQQGQPPSASDAGASLQLAPGDDHALQAGDAPPAGPPKISDLDIRRMVTSHINKLTGNGTARDVAAGLAGLQEVAQLLEKSLHSPPQVRARARAA